MTIDFNVLFTRLGKGFNAQAVCNTARGTTLPPEVKEYTDEFASASLALQQCVGPAEAANRNFQSGAAALMTGLQSSMRTCIIETVTADVVLASYEFTSCIKELIRQMTVEAESVDASTVSATASAVTGNGDGVLVASAKRADGRYVETCLAETLTVECEADSTPATASFTCRGTIAQSDRLSQDWPKGSGVVRSLSAVNATAGAIVTNGGFDSDDDRANVPDGWYLATGTPGTTIKLTANEVQQIVITGTPTAGSWNITWQHPNGKTYVTDLLAFNASGATVQAELRELPGLTAVEVTTTGTSPNFTHSIQFLGVAGNLAQVAVINNTTGGTFTPSTTTGGSANAYVDRALEFDSDGSQLTTLYQELSLDPLAQYAVNLWALADVVPVAGVITIDLVDGIGGSVVADEAAVNNTFAITCSALTTSFAAKSGVFRTPRVLPAAVYLRVRISTAISSGTSVFLDHLGLTEMTEAYPGGPSLSIFSGKSPFTKGAPTVRPDYFTVAVANDRAGLIQEWFDRNFDMRSKGLLLPSNSAGTETLADSLVG